MKLFAQLPAFTSGLAVVLFAYGYFADVHAQSGDREAIVACADGDGRLRLNEPAGVCEPGETQVPLKSVEMEREEKKAPDPAVADLQKRLSELEDRLGAAAKMLDGKVEAPFEVFNPAGTRVFAVEEQTLGSRSIRAFNDAGKEAAWINIADSGAFLRLWSTTSQLIAEFEPEDFQVRDRELDDRRIDLGPTEGPRHALRLYNKAERVIAGIGQSMVESGVVLIGDEQGKPRFRMSMGSQAANFGKVELVNTEDIEIATLGVDDRQNGLLQLRNKEGVTMVEAGTVKSVGIVLAGPGAFRHGLHFVGLPASYIEGKPK